MAFFYLFLFFVVACPLNEINQANKILIDGQHEQRAGIIMNTFTMWIFLRVIYGFLVAIFFSRSIEYAAVALVIDDSKHN